MSPGNDPKVSSDPPTCTDRIQTSTNLSAIYERYSTANNAEPTSTAQRVAPSCFDLDQDSLGARNPLGRETWGGGGRLWNCDAQSDHHAMNANKNKRRRRRLAREEEVKGSGLKHKTWLCIATCHDGCSARHRNVSCTGQVADAFLD